MDVDDLFRLEQVGAVATSPNGEWLAVVITRAATSAETYRDFPLGGDHADIWLVSRRGTERRQLTNGVADGSGYWNPVWSPDGRRLALLSTKGGDDVRPHVYDLASGTLRRLTEHGADLQAYADEGWPNYAMLWRDSTTLLCAVRPDGSPPTYYAMSKIRSYTEAVRAWDKATQGMEPTVSVLESGRELTETERPAGHLLSIDVVSGRSRVVAEGNFRQLMLSPTRQYVALFAETGRIPPRPTQRVPYEMEERFWDLWRTRLAILPLEGDVKPVWVDGVFDPKLVPGRLLHSWSPDGSALAVIAKGSKDDETATALWLVSATDRRAHQVAVSGFRAKAAAWSGGGDLLVLARPEAQRGSAGDVARLDWWVIDREHRGAARNLTGGFKVVPPVLFRASSGRAMLGVASGDLWSIRLADGTVTNLTDSFDHEIQFVAWPVVATQARAGTDLIIQTGGDRFFRISLAGAAARTEAFPRPSNTAMIADFRPEQNVVAYTATQPNGTFLWIGDGRVDRFDLKLKLNPYLSEIGDAKRLLVSYRSVDGDSLTAILVLPVGYQPGKRYPLVTWVYGGSVYSDTTYWLLDKQRASALNLHLLPSHGYALLVPSIPLSPPQQGSDPYIDLPKGVMAAVDRAIDLGIADPQRLAVMGQSYGGFSTYALVTYTHRFKAAITISGFANLVSLYGTFFAPLRYDDYAHEVLFQPALAESGLVRMGGAPSSDLWRYLRNSPLYFVDRVRTPLMIIQGDIDYVPIEQGEEFFTALYRMGKRAKFVRYWGEGHLVSSPANIRDMWHQIFDWLDECFVSHSQPVAASEAVGAE